jgi:hypothetical protein
MSARHRKSDFQGSFTGLPDDPSSRLDALIAIHKEFRRALIQQLQPVVRSLLQEKPPTTTEGRKELVHRLNFVFRDVGIAAIDSDSGSPSSVIADSSRLFLQSRTKNAEGRRTHSRNMALLPPLELVEHIRQEPFLAWHEKINQTKPPVNRQR